MHLIAQTPASRAGIAYAPDLLPDELLYSWLARVAAHNALGAPRDVLEQFFGCRTLVPSVDLPTRLLAMAHQLGGWLPFASLDELLEAGTLLPYHRPFLTEATCSRVSHSLLHGDGKGLKTMMGRVANRFGAHPALRSCPVCMTESWSRSGDMYWMRRHQLPGVNCCAVHGIPLQYTPLHARAHRQRLLLPIAMPGTRRLIKSDARQLRFAQLSQELVEAALPVIAPSQRATAYREAALELGYGSRRSRVDFPALTRALRRRFDDFEGFDHRTRLLATVAHPLGWLRPLFEKPQQSLHPICHLLLIEFLFGSVAAFEAVCAARSLARHPLPTEEPLLAQAAEAPDGTCATEPEASSSALVMDNEDALRDPSLSCRQVAASIGQSVTTVVAWRRARGVPIRERRKSLHPTVIDGVLKAMGSLRSLPAVAARAGVSLSSVYRILAQYPATPRPRQDAASIAQKPLRRARWTAALQTCGKEGIGRVTAARAHAGADYAWLYRHDRTWLASTSICAAPPSQHPIDRPARVDWVRRDADLCQQLAQQIGMLHDEVPPRRLTKTRLLRPLGETMVRRNLDRLPRLGALLDKAVESAQAFGLRRVDHAIALLVRDGTQLQLWRIQRLAGLRRWSKALTIHANQQVERLNAQNSLRPQRLP